MLTHRPTTAELATAVLVLAADGRVEIANAPARELWAGTATPLVHAFLPTLFSFEMTAQEADWIALQWEVVLAAAQAQALELKIQPTEAPAFAVWLRLEKISDEPARYLALLNRPAITAPPQPIVVTPAPVPDNFLAQLNDRSPLGFFDLNFLKQEVYYSPTWKRLLGYTDAALPNTYETWLTLIHPDDSAAAPDRQGRGGATGSRQFALEFRMKHASGYYVWLQSVGMQIYGPNGALQRVIGAHLDISERKEVEETTLRAEERLLEIADRGRLGVFDLNFSQGLAWLSAGFRAQLGYAEHELPDTLESFLRALPMDETAGGLPAYFLAQHPNQIAYFDNLRLRHHDGRELLVHAGIVRHISRRKELQRVLGFIAPMPAGSTATARSTEPSPELPAAHLATLLGEIQEAVLLTDATGRVIFINAQAEKFLGGPAEEIIGQPSGEFFRLTHRLSGQPGESPIAKALTAGEATTLNTEFSLDRGAAPAVPIAFSTRAVINEVGRAIGTVVVFRNPDEMTLTPEELVRANRFESLGQLAGGIAHDFNNLLTTILGGISMAKDARDPAGLENSERACLAAKSLSKQLLTFAKGGTTVRQVLKPADLLQDSIGLASVGSTVHFDLQVEPDLSAICVDRGQILQVFQNLIINAIQSMTTGRGGIWIRAKNVKLAEGEVPPLPADTYVAIEVRDNGGGIKPEHLANIYAAFFTTKKTGTGLGLATVLANIKQHNGQISVQSDVGVGTAFTVYLPQADKPEEIEARRAPSLRFGTGRILFMDDDPQICELTSRMLTSLGYKTDLAKNGEEAIQFYKRYLNIGRPYDAVIMDLTIIGGMGGEETFKALRELDPQVCAIVTSGYDNDDMRRQYLDLGFCDYLTKPYRVGDLGKSLRSVLGK